MLLKNNLTCSFKAIIEMTEINQLKEEITRLHKRVAELEQHGDLNHKTESQLQLLKSISLLHEVFWDKGIHYGWCNNVIENLLTLSNSEFGFICELFHKEDGTPFIKSHGISNILWSAEVKKLYEENIENGLDFFNFKSIWGNAITTGELYISHTPENDAHGYSKKQGHPPLKSFMGIPIKDSKDEVVGIVGMANNPNGYTKDLADFLATFVSTYGLLIEKDKIAKQEELNKQALIKVKENAEVNEKRYKGLIDNLRAGVVVHAADTSIIANNLQAEKLLGLSSEQLEGKKAYDEEWHFTDLNNNKLVAEEYPVNTILRTKKPLKNYQAGVYYPTSKSKVYLSVNGFPVFNSSGEISEIVISFVDVSSTKKAEQELILAKEKAEENEQELLQAKEIEEKNVEMILSSQSIAHICSYSTNLNKTDIEKSVWDCSPEFYKIFGIDETYPHTIAGWANFIHPDYREKLLAYHESVIKNRGSFNNEYKIIRINDGEERWVHGTGELVYDEQGSPVRMFGAIQDITELKQTESELIKAKDKAEESDRLKSAFLANMSHEIRTPMNGILGFTNLLRNPDLTGKQQQDYVKIIQKSGDRMLNTVNDIIEISQIETGQITVTSNPVNISKHLKTLNEFFRLEAENKGLQLMIDNQLAKADSLIQTDENKFGSILINLIKNAIKFTDKGRIIIGCKKKGEFIEFNVKDTGVGIPANRTEAIFNRFEQADIEDSRALQGSGLGLSIVHSYVDMLGGEIWVKSKEGVGSQFYFTLPYNTVTIKTPEKNLDTLNKSNIQNKGLKVLISDDDETAIMYLKIILEEFEKEILIAKNGIEAVEICRQHSDIDLILMDIKMPGLNGYEATEKIREFNDRVFIVAQTAFALPGDREKALEAGCDDYISKPINRDVLLELIKKQF